MLVKKYYIIGAILNSKVKILICPILRFMSKYSVHNKSCSPLKTQARFLCIPKSYSQKPTRIPSTDSSFLARQWNSNFFFIVYSVSKSVISRVLTNKLQSCTLSLVPTFLNLSAPVLLVYGTCIKNSVPFVTAAVPCSSRGASFLPWGDLEMAERCRFCQCAPD